MLWNGVRTVMLGGMLLGLAACGGEDRGPAAAEGEAGEAPPVSAAREGEQGMAGSAKADECIELVEAGEFERAREICAEAAEASPQNREVQDALREARQQAGEAAEQTGEALPE